MNKNIKFYFQLIFIMSIGIFLFNCRKMPSTNPTTSSISEIDTFTVREIEFKYLAAKAKVKFKDANNDIGATANIRIKKDSLIWLSIVPALGIEASRCLITQDSIFMLDRINNQFSSFSYESLDNKINIHLSYAIIQSMLLGSLPFSKTKSDLLTKSQNKEYFILKQKINDMLVENYVKASTMKLEKFDILEEKTNKDLQVVYSNFLPLNNFFFPYEYNVSVTYPANNSLQHTSITVEYNKVELPEKELNFPFNIPNKYLKK